VSLRQSCEALENTNSSLEQRCHELSQQLKIASLAVKELEGSQEVTVALERELEEIRQQAGEKESRVVELERVRHQMLWWAQATI